MKLKNRIVNFKFLYPLINSYDGGKYKICHPFFRIWQVQNEHGVWE